MCLKPLQRLIHRNTSELYWRTAEVSLAAAKTNRDAADKCEKRFRDLKSAIDEVEDALE